LKHEARMKASHRHNGISSEVFVVVCLASSFDVHGGTSL